jgi:hypothetical protein
MYTIGRKNNKNKFMDIDPHYVKIWDGFAR